MLPKTISISIDQFLLATFNKLPVRLAKRVLWLLHSNPTLGDKWGYYIRQFHYYEPLPDFSVITRKHVIQKRLLTCIDWNIEYQIDLAKRLIAYSGEIKQITEKKFKSLQFDFLNEVFFELDAAVYYSILRELKPSKVIEVGCGYSTQIAALAIAMNQQEGKAGKIICIEPYPQPRLTEPNLDVELISEKVEDIDLSFFAQLGAGDILFIDSTHTVKFGSDVCREILEILPAIPSGVWIHFHDIFSPYDYPAKWLIEERRAWNEQYMLEAFLAYNHSFEVVLANHLLSVDYPEEAAKIWPGVSKWKDPYHHCGSLWLRKK
ncbi:class I SAM-dependent methyltransferase [Oxynema aestuarii]|uniref:Class I SAM-dependent methyltransferase n=1 Tax=Oxynema aestuarii AP17 TaxID=2064643 RepID=A0A6H1U225_9CYAN|nr:class I SAM-dependent methyltransferase [Oxynema aestuarii]QIZ72496.1 class I SAM-dependent methyltransferase [Oxynema aestuarii AP17]